VHVVAAGVLTGEDELVSAGPPVDAAMASMNGGSPDRGVRRQQAAPVWRHDRAPASGHGCQGAHDVGGKDVSAPQTTPDGREPIRSSSSWVTGDPGTVDGAGAGADHEVRACVAFQAGLQYANLDNAETGCSRQDECRTHTSVNLGSGKNLLDLSHRRQCGYR
jgi:hypothetical protein